MLLSPNWYLWTVKRSSKINARYENCLGETKEKGLVTACGSTQGRERRMNSHCWSRHVTKNSSAARNQSKSWPWDYQPLGFRSTWNGIQVRFMHISKNKVTQVTTKVHICLHFKALFNSYWKTSITLVQGAGEGQRDMNQTLPLL